MGKINTVIFTKHFLSIALIQPKAEPQCSGTPFLFSIIMIMGLGLPTGTIAFWGSHVLRLLTVDYTFKP